MRGDAGIKLAHSAGGEVSRVGERGKALTLALFIEFLEGGGRHQQLAANLEICRDAGFLQLAFVNRERNGADRADVRCDVFAHRAVPASDSPRQAAVLIS